MSEISLYIKKTVEVRLEGSELVSMAILCEFAKRYIKLKKPKEGNYISWPRDKVVVDEYRAESINQVFNLIITFEVSLRSAAKHHENLIYDELESKEVEALPVLCEIVRRYIELKPQTEIMQKVLDLALDLEYNSDNAN